MYGLCWLKKRLQILTLLILIGQWNGGLVAQEHDQSEIAFPTSPNIYYSENESYSDESYAQEPYVEESHDNNIDDGSAYSGNIYSETDADGIVYLPYSQYFIDSHESSNIRFRADFPLAGVDALIGEVNALEHDLVSYLSLSEERELIEIFVFEQKKKYVDFIMKEFPGAPLDRTALFVKQPGVPGIVILQLTRDIDDDLRHEMTHAFLHSRFVNIPIWLDEGLAEYFELPQDQRALQKPYMKKATNSFIFSKTATSLKKIEKINDIYSFGLKEYQESWAWIHFMIHHSQETHQLLAAYLTQIGHGKISTPLEQYLAEVLPEYKKEYVQHFEKWNQIRSGKTEKTVRTKKVDKVPPPKSEENKDVAATEKKKSKFSLFR